MDRLTPDGLALVATVASPYAQCTSIWDAAAEFADLYNLNDIGLAMRVDQGRIDDLTSS